jgi:hypothetical protein
MDARADVAKLRAPSALVARLLFEAGAREVYPACAVMRCCTARRTWRARVGARCAPRTST